MAKKNQAMKLALVGVGLFALYELVLKKPATTPNTALLNSGSKPATASNSVTSTASALSSLVNSVKNIFSPTGSDPTQGTNPYKVSTPALEVDNSANTGQGASPASGFPTLSTNAPSLNFSNAGSEVMNEQPVMDEALSGMRLVC